MNDIENNIDIVEVEDTSTSSMEELMYFNPKYVDIIQKFPTYKEYLYSVCKRIRPK